MGSFSNNAGSYEGEFKDGVVNGFGTFWNNNGNVYQGYCKSAKFDGLGILYVNGQVSQAGVWSNGNFVNTARIPWLESRTSSATSSTVSSSQKTLPGFPNGGQKNSDILEIVGWTIFGLLAASGLYFFMKVSSKCPSCKAEWAWKTVSSIDEPRSTFQEKRKTGHYSSGPHEGRIIYTVDTYETGVRTKQFACEKCGHQKTSVGSYKKQISSHQE